MCDGGLGEVILKGDSKGGQAEVTVIRLDRISAPYVIYICMSSLRVAVSNGSTFTKALNPFCSVPGGAKE